MKTKMFLLTTAVALSSGAFALLAQDAPPPPPAGKEGKPPGGEGRPPGPPQGGADRLAEYIMRSDTDKDGKISKEEFVASTKKESEDRFSKIDANTDGYVDKTEIEEAGRKMREQGGRPPGEGGPSNMRRPEGGGPDGFRRPEGDGTRPRPGQEGQPGGNPPGDNGFRRPEGSPPPGGGDNGFRRPEGGSPGGSPGGGSEGMRRGGGESGRGGFSGGMGDIMQRLDKNKDGTLSKEEYFSTYEERFASMDENKDGKLTTEETEAYGKRMREQYGLGGGGSGTPGGSGSAGGARRPEGGGGGNRPEGERPKRPEGEAPTPPKE